MKLQDGPGICFARLQRELKIETQESRAEGHLHIGELDIQEYRARHYPRKKTFGREGIKPLDIQRWLKSLNSEKELAWTTIAKMRGVMSRIYKVGVLHERVSKNPVQHVETRSTTTYRAIVISPTQTLEVLKSLEVISKPCTRG